MRHLVSFEHFLSTGTLGPLSADLNLLQVAALLGPPQHWMTKNVEAYPLYWIYGDTTRWLKPALEVEFYPDAPHAMHMFQFEHADMLEHEVHTFGQELAVSMDGFTGSTRPSEFLKRDMWKGRDVRVYFTTHHFEVTIVAGQVMVHFMIHDGDQYDETEKQTYLEAFGADSRFGDIDQRCELNSIAAVPKGANTSPGPYFDMKNCSGQEYLKALAG